MPSLSSSSDISGVLAAAVTPRRPGTNTVDLGSLLELIDFLGSAGVHGIVLMGTTGEFVHFEIEDRARLVSLAVKRSRVPVLINVSHSTLDGAVHLANQAAKSGATGVMLMPPYYLLYSQEAILEFYRQFAASVNGLPVYLYNIPAFTSAIDAATAVELLTNGRFAGIKDSSGSWDNFAALRDAARKTPFTLLSGSERLYARVRREGAHGIVSGVSSAIPELVLALERAVQNENDARVAILDGRLVEFLDRIEQFPATFGIKEAAALRGLKTGPTAIPLAGTLNDRMNQYREWFAGWWSTVKTETEN